MSSKTSGCVIIVTTNTGSMIWLLRQHKLWHKYSVTYMATQAGVEFGTSQILDVSTLYNYKV